ncbi:hypothetical protein FRB96_005028 [Tulasnella sp. 330]|nr:hypothetical protein FRB96_005028 [Tulasnella sp. 330]
MSKEANAAYSHKDHNYTLLQAFEWYVDGKGVHWKKLEQQVPRLSEIGITAMWLPPPTKASGTDSVGYDTYDLYDLGEFDQKGGTRTNWGTKEELLRLIRVGNEHGVVTYLDAVLNHKFGADHIEKFKAVEVDPNDRTKTTSDPYDIEGWTGFDFPGRGDKYSSFKWTFDHFTGVDYNAEGGKKGIFKIAGDNKGWALGVDTENANYDYLMGADIDHAHPDAATDIKNWGSWVIAETGASGFRFDAIKHIDEGFIADFVEHVRKTSGKEKMFCVGEFWKDSLESLSTYLTKFGQQFSVFDTPLHYKFKEAGDAGNSFDLRSIWDGTLVQKRPLDAITMTSAFVFRCSLSTQVGQSLESSVAPWFKPLAYALILLRVDGYPCVFYGDLYGCAGQNPQPAVDSLDKLISARKLYAYGETRDYWDHQNCVGWIRTGDETYDGCAVVLCNGDADGHKHMEVGKDHAGEKWMDILGWYEGEVTIGEDGWADFSCHARSLSVWINKDGKKTA